MSEHLIKGKPIANNILKDVKQRATKLADAGNPAKLAVVLIGKDKPSHTYVRKKGEMAKKVGIDFEVHLFEEDIAQDTLIEKIKAIQTDKSLSGLIVQLPIPEHLYTPEVLNSVHPDVDVDCLTHENIGKLAMNAHDIIPPTPGAVISVIENQEVDVTGKNVVIIGVGALVGKPLSLIMMNQRASVTTCNSATADTKEKCLAADIIITGVGKKDLLTGDMVAPGTIVIDAGISFENEKMYGDVNVDDVLKSGAKVTPTPGGTGPITVARLLQNTIILTEKKSR